MGTTAFSYSAKSELPSAAHCFLATVGPLSATGTSSIHLSALSSIAGIAVGMAVTGTNVAATVVSVLVSQTAVDLALATTGAPSAVYFTGDVFKILLIKVSPGGTYAGGQTNVGTPATGAPTLTDVGTDEVANGSGYTTNGFTLTNISPLIGSTAAYWSF